MADQKLKIKTGLSTPMFSAPRQELAAKGAKGHAGPSEPLSEDVVKLGGKPSNIGNVEAVVSASDEANESLARQMEHLRKEKEENDRRLANEKVREQKEKLKLMRECEGILLVNYDWLDMPDYPQNEFVLQAKNRRDYGLLLNFILFAGCMISVFGWLPAWVGGSCLGLLFLSVTILYTPLRRYVGITVVYSEVVENRRQQEYKALGHIRLLEGKSGLAWRVEKLARYNSALSKTVFKGIFKHSRSKDLLSVLKTRAHIRLYLLLMIEGQKAYQRLKDDYFATHRKLRDLGVDDDR